MSLKVLARNTLSNGGAMFIRMSINFILTPFLITHLGNEVYGIWTFILSFSLTGTLSLFSLGFQGALVKYVAEYHAVKKTKELNEVISSTIFIYTVMGIIASALLFLFSFYLGDLFNIPPVQLTNARILIYIMSFQVLFELPSLSADAILTGLQRFDILAFLEVGKISLIASSIFICISYGYGVISIGLIVMIVTLLHSLSLMVFSKKLLPDWKIVTNFEKKTMMELLGFTKDLIFLRINGMVYNNMDKLIIGAFLTSTLVTDYDIANRIHSIALMIMGLAPSVVLPAASAFVAANEKDHLRSLLIKGTKYTLVLTLPVVFSLFVLSEPLIKFWISPQYSHVAFYAKLFLIYMSFWPAVQVGWNMLVGAKVIKSLIKIQIISVLINLLCTILLVRSIGVSGTMIGTIIGNGIITIPYLALILKTFEVHPMEFVKSVILKTYPQAIICMGILYFVLSIRYPKSLIEVGLYAFVALSMYYVFFFLTGIDKAEKENFYAVGQNWFVKVAALLVRT